MILSLSLFLCLSLSLSFRPSPRQFTVFSLSTPPVASPHYYQRVSVDPADAKVSYPSGHSSTSAAALALIALYIAGKLRCALGGRWHIHSHSLHTTSRERLDVREMCAYGEQEGCKRKGTKWFALIVSRLVFNVFYSPRVLCVSSRTFRHGQLWKAVISGVWLFGAFAIAITRTRDYHHNFSDINAGMAIGFLSALVGYHLNFYPLTSKRCYLPINRLYAPDAVQ